MPNKKPKKAKEEEKVVDLSVGYDNIVTQKRMGTIFVPKTVLFQKPEYIQLIMREVIVMNVMSQGKYGDELYYSCISEHFDTLEVIKDNPPAYTVIVKPNSDTVEFQRSELAPPSFKVDMEEFDETEDPKENPVD